MHQLAEDFARPIGFKVKFENLSFVILEEKYSASNW